jgi:hypothetical protein
MNYLKRETQLLEDLLRHFHSDVPLKDNQWLLLYFYLFEEDELPFIVEDEQLAETVQYLRDIISANSFSAMVELMDFYESKKMKLKKFLHTMLKETSPSANVKIGK